MSNSVKEKPFHDPTVVKPLTWKDKWKNFWFQLDQKSKRHLTFMLVPHTERSPIQFHISYKKIFFIVLSTILIVIISSVYILDKSGSIHEHRELELSQKDYQRQSERLKQRIQNIHVIIDGYYQRLSDLYLKLGGDHAKLTNQIDPKEKALLNINDYKTDIPTDTFKVSSDIYDLKVVNDLTKDVNEMIKKKNALIKNTPSIWPVKGYILFPYGVYISPVTGEKIRNNGIDIASFPGSEVSATATGMIYEIGYTEASGNYIKIAHKLGWKTMYSNLERLQVKRNQIVSKGTIIGYVGKQSGIPVHFVHYEVHVGTKALNPFLFLKQVDN